MTKLETLKELIERTYTDDLTVEYGEEEKVIYMTEHASTLWGEERRYIDLEAVEDLQDYLEEKCECTYRGYEYAEYKVDGYTVKYTVDAPEED